VQTFLPYEDFRDSAAVLDSKRLGKQRVECLQIYDCLVGRGSTGWRNHPAVKMWRGHEWWLLLYAIEICVEWRRRGYRDTLLPRFMDEIERCPDSPAPRWLGLNELHSSHRGNLIRKDPVLYGSNGWTERPMTGYYWPKDTDAI